MKATSDAGGRKCITSPSATQSRLQENDRMEGLKPGADDAMYFARFAPLAAVLRNCLVFVPRVATSPLRINAVAVRR